MTQKVVDQHELLNRWREIADELAGALCIGRGSLPPGTDRRALAEAALRRYEEARDE